MDLDFFKVVTRQLTGWLCLSGLDDAAAGLFTVKVVLQLVLRISFTRTEAQFMEIADVCDRSPAQVPMIVVGENASQLSQVASAGDTALGLMVGWKCKLAAAVQIRNYFDTLLTIAAPVTCVLRNTGCDVRLCGLGQSVKCCAGDRCIILC